MTCAGACYNGVRILSQFVDFMLDRCVCMWPIVAGIRFGGNSLVTLG